MIDRQRPDDRVLGQIRILVFVDQDKSILPVESSADLGVLPQQRGDVHQQVVEVGGVGRPELGLVSWVNFPGGLADHTVGMWLVLFGGYQVVFRPANGLGNGLRGETGQVDLHPVEHPT